MREKAIRLLGKLSNIVPGLEATKRSSLRHPADYTVREQRHKATGQVVRYRPRPGSSQNFLRCVIQPITYYVSQSQGY